MQRISQEELGVILQQLNQALLSHGEWFETLNREMICHLPLDMNNTRDDAHRECEFGLWLYNEINPHLREHPAFDVIEREHHHMHQAMARMLTSVSETGSTQLQDYDRFSIAMKRLRLEINTLTRELEASLYNLDPLTGANSRIGMLSHLREQMEMVKRGAEQFSLAMLDLDHFKQINDAHGHIAGDRMLTAVAHYILESIRPYDRLYRYGGEEFLLTLPHTEESAVLPMLERIRKGILQQRVVIEEGKTAQITISIGIFTVNDALPVELAIQRADQAMYAAKHLGRNRSQLWSPEMAVTEDQHA